MTTPTAPPASARRRLSTSRCLTSRQRAAPSARRTASSRLRVVDRARKRLARFTHAISRTRPTAPSNRNAAGRTSFSNAAAQGTAARRQPSYSLNDGVSVCSTRPAIAASSVLAWVNETPGASLAMTLNWRIASRRSPAVSPPHGSHRSVPISKSPGGMTPTTVAVSPPMRIARFTMLRSAPNRVCHRR